jgi:L-threonylcarbamoyladenylate synthase
VIIPDSAPARESAARIILSGGVISFRTDTFYGLGADPANESAVSRIRELKGRDDRKPILLLLADLSEVDRFIAVRSDLFTRLADRFWPGPLTIVGAAASQLADVLTAGSKTIGVRLPNDEAVRTLLRCCGGALTATSANISGRPPAATAESVADYFGETVDLIIDGGESTLLEPSTVVDVSTGVARVVRVGAVPAVKIQAVLKETSLI